MERNLAIAQDTIETIRDQLFPWGAANQRAQIRAHGGEATARHWLKEALGNEDPYDDFGRVAVRYGGGVCHDYTAAALGMVLNHQINDPIQVIQDEESEHDYLLIGDPRDRRYSEKGTVVLDAWVNKPKAHTADKLRWNIYSPLASVVQQYNGSNPAIAASLGAPSKAELYHLASTRRVKREVVDVYLETNNHPPIGEGLARELLEGGNEALFDEDKSYRSEEE